MNRGNALNALLFQAAWFACVLGGARDAAMWGLIAVVGLAGYSLAAGTVGRDGVLASVAAVVGFLLETVWIRTGVLVYAGAAVAPVWIVLLWVGVGLTLNHSLAFLQRRPWLGGALAGATAPLSYLAGERFGAVQIPDVGLLAAVSAAWFVLFTLGFALARAGDVFERGGRAAAIINGKRSVT